MKKTCEVCGNWTDRPLDDFHEIGWSAFSIGNEKAKCFCPLHQKECKQVMHDALRPK